ncbi:hypothetical protein AB1Y20_013475 [Prymnesium parvum]|uniref:G-protein coupled receptors family 3 profile domain-containing protein n=1 Tax=Prymnesium parvum TaxID=97485 RepID=A0AB34IFI8_PRYPA
MMAAALLVASLAAGRRASVHTVREAPRDSGRLTEDPPPPSSALRSLESRLDGLCERIEDLERVAPKEFEVFHYNVLARQYGSNMQPWFLYGAGVSDAERRQMLERFYAAGPDGQKQAADKGWPGWAEGVLSKERRASIEAYHEASFSWERRRERLWDVVRGANADVVTLAECDCFDSFWKPKFDSAAYGVVWRKRPRPSSPDGCAIAWRNSTFELLGVGGFDFGSSLDRLPDRTCLFALLRWRRDPNQRLLVATAHLARMATSVAESADQLLARGFQCTPHLLRAVPCELSSLRLSPSSRHPVHLLVHVDSPFVYVVSILERDEYGRPTQSYGQCTADERVWTYIALLIAFHGMLLLVANSLVYQLRHVPSEYNEGKYVGISLANNLQTSLVALMLLFLVTDNPQVIFSVKFFEVYWSATLTLLMMFLPKILIVHINDESDLTAASEVMREAKKGRAEQPKTMKSTFESIFTLRSSFNASARPSVVPHAGDLNIPATKVEQAQAIARELMTCVNRQATVSEWLSTAALKVETMSNDAEMSEKADTVAHLIVQGEHLRFLLKKAARRGA